MVVSNHLEFLLVVLNCPKFISSCLDFSWFLKSSLQLSKVLLYLSSNCLELLSSPRFLPTLGLLQLSLDLTLSDLPKVKPRANLVLTFFTVLIQKSEKQLKVLSGCLKKFPLRTP